MRKLTPPKLPFDPDTLVPAATVGDFLNVSAERIRQLADEGVLPRVERGKFPLRSCCRAYATWTRDEQRKVNRSAAASRVTDARAREIELRIAEREGRLIDSGDAMDAIDDICGTVLSGLGALPARVTDDIALRRNIEDEIATIQSGIANVLGERGTALQAGRDPLASKKRRR